MLNENGLPQHLREVTHEANVTVEEDGESKNKKPDYAFRIGTAEDRGCPERGG